MEGESSVTRIIIGEPLFSYIGEVQMESESDVIPSIID